MKHTMKNALLFLLICACLFTHLIFAQKSSNPKATSEDKEPSTKFEKFLARKGILFIKESYAVGTLATETSAMLTKYKMGEGWKVKFKAATVGILGDNQKVYALRIEVPGDRRAEIGILDFDEAVSLDSALAYITKKASEMKTEHHEYTEILFSTIGGVEVGFYQEGRDKQNAFLRANKWSSDAYVSFDVSSLPELKLIISKGIEKLRALGAK